MKKTETIKKNYEFKRILTRGKYLSGKYIECFYMQNKNGDENKIGIAIYSKLAKANKRNRAKRLIKEAYKNIENNIRAGKRMVFLWKKKQNILEANYCEIEKDIMKILKEMDMFINE